LSPRIRRQIQAGLRARIAPLAQRLRRLKGDEGERRYYYRVYDFNAPAWKASRRQAEPHREKLHALFDRKVLDELLPPPDTDAILPHGIVDASSRKLLVGLCLWAGEHL
jgi:asparagine synthase (glutamine-hydrolysing)